MQSCAIFRKQLPFAIGCLIVLNSILHVFAEQQDIAEKDPSTGERQNRFFGRKKYIDDEGNKNDPIMEQREAGISVIMVITVFGSATLGLIIVISLVVTAVYCCKKKRKGKEAQHFQFIWEKQPESKEDDLSQEPSSRAALSIHGPSSLRTNTVQSFGDTSLKVPSSYRPKAPESQSSHESISPLLSSQKSQTASIGSQQQSAQTQSTSLRPTATVVPIPVTTESIPTKTYCTTNGTTTTSVPTKTYRTTSSDPPTKTYDGTSHTFKTKKSDSNRESSHSSSK